MFFNFHECLELAKQELKDTPVVEEFEQNIEILENLTHCGVGISATMYLKLLSKKEEVLTCLG